MAGSAAASAQLEAISSSSAFLVYRPWSSSISRTASYASASASADSPAASKMAHRYRRHLQPPVARDDRVEVGERGREISGGEGRKRAVAHRVQRLEFLADL